MKKVININFQGRVVPIEESAYDNLQQYIDSLRVYFANEEGRDEIINDIEGRIAELFAEVLQKGNTCITDADVETILNSMGRPQDFDAEGVNGNEQTATDNTATHSNTYTTTGNRLFRDENNKILGGVCSGIANYLNIDPLIIRILTAIFIGVTFVPYLVLWIAVPSTASKVIGAQRKKLYRDPDDKIIAGVCSGLSKYFGINVWIPRALFILPFISFAFRHWNWGLFDFPSFINLSFSPGALVIYIIFWIVLPEAKTAAEKLELRGEKVDVESIKNTIQSDMEGFKDRAEKMGNDIKNKAQQFGKSVSEKSKEMGTEATTVARKTGRGLGDVIVLLFKIFAYFIIGVVVFSIVAALFALGVVFTGLMPLKNYILESGWQTVFAWGTLLFFIWVPVIGIVTFIIRKIANIKGNKNIIRYSFTALWLIGLFCFIGLMVSLRNNFRYRNNAIEQNIAIQQPSKGYLEIIRTNENKFYYNNNRWFKLDPFTSMDDDSVFVRNITIRIVQSATDSFNISVVKLANGESRTAANVNADAIHFNIVQNDSTIRFNNGIAINQNNKFRNQHAVVTIAVPIGKKIKITSKNTWDNGNDNVFIGFDNNWNWDWNDDAYNWHANRTYIMTKNGLKAIDGKDDMDDTDNNNENPATNDSKKELKQKLDQLQKESDELKKELNQPEKSDSNRYHYQPELPKKTKVTATSNDSIDMLQQNVTDFIRMRFAI
ncbi:MAG: PspC domain-containing protein [Bacteroidota bacterium]|jgi:phage shock protein PspC (stress-responsive transcriptional regulator)|nr:PspC domain-containing protein [Bacteroidota bacterium]